jgi:DNA-binding NarL/FixJ family response regulator
VAKTVTSDALAEIVVAARAPAASIPQRADSEADSSPLLTSREREVLRMIAQAYTNRDIAAHLRIAEGTVKRHATNMYVKLGATSRIDAVRKATRLGLFD